MKTFSSVKVECTASCTEGQGFSVKVKYIALFLDCIEPIVLGLCKLRYQIRKVVARVMIPQEH